MTQTIVLRTVALGLMVALPLGGGCKSPPPAASPNAPINTPQTLSTGQPAPQMSTPAQTGPRPQLTPATIYTAAADCVTFVPKTVDLPQENITHAAVAQVLASQPAIASELAGYAVQRNGDSATIDFQMRPQAQKSIASLSLCEQFALFGSLRKTLVQIPDGGIKTVQFTQDGKDLSQ